jgi:hypothetical protein
VLVVVVNPLLMLAAGRELLLVALLPNRFRKRVCEELGGMRDLVLMAATFYSNISIFVLFSIVVVSYGGQASRERKRESTRSFRVRASSRAKCWNFVIGLPLCSVFVYEPASDRTKNRFARCHPTCPRRSVLSYINLQLAVYCASSWSKAGRGRRLSNVHTHGVPQRRALGL